jgi:hypothetical protein
LVTLFLIRSIAIGPILIEAGALRRLTIAVAGVLLATILARHPVLALLVFMSFLVGHEFPPRCQTTQAMCPAPLVAEPLRLPEAPEDAVLQPDGVEVAHDK